jgi:hypothetical protein
MRARLCRMLIEHGFGYQQTGRLGKNAVNVGRREDAAGDGPISIDSGADGPHRLGKNNEWRL